MTCSPYYSQTDCIFCLESLNFKSQDKSQDKLWDDFDVRSNCEKFCILEEQHVVMLKCKHYYHSNCFIKYCKHNYNCTDYIKCPMCRKNISVKELFIIINSYEKLLENIINNINQNKKSLRKRIMYYKASFYYKKDISVNEIDRLNLLCKDLKDIKKQMIRKYDQVTVVRIYFRYKYY